MRCLALICCLAAAPAATTAGQAPSSPEPYSLFNRTPRDLWRELSPDRPDATESPYTVPAGVFQVEMSFFDYSRDSHNDADATFERWAIGADTNLKAGLLPNTDLQLVFAPYAEERTELDAGPTTTLSGFSDLTVRLKVNLYGNDGGETALGLLPFLRIPTGTSVSTDKADGGIAVPFAWNIAPGVGLGVMGQLDFIYDDGEDDYDIGFLHTVVLGFDIAGPLGGYVEYVGNVLSDSGSDYEASFSGGLTYSINPDVVLDAGVLAGLTRAANDFSVFSGITFRF